MPLTDEELAGLETRELLQLGVDLFNAGRYFDAHEAWEEAWLPSEQPLRWFYQGLIQIAAAFVHLTRNEYPGTEKLLEEGLAKLEKFQPDYLGIEVEALVREGMAARRRVIEAGPRGLRQIDQASLPRIGQQVRPESRFFESAGVKLHWLEWPNAGIASSSPFESPSTGLRMHPRTNGELGGAFDSAPTADREAIVLLHAPAHVARVWQPVAARLAESHRVLAPDLPGHGKSATSGDIDADVETLRAWLRSVASDVKAVVSFGPSAGLAARLAPEIGAIEVSMGLREATGPGDGEASGARSAAWPGRWEMFAALEARSQFAHWRPDVLWTYVEDGTELIENGRARLRCNDSTETRFLALGRPVGGAVEINESPLEQPVQTVERLKEIIDSLP